MPDWFLQARSIVEGAGISTGGSNVALASGSAVLTGYLGFEAGGFFPGSTGVAALAVAIAMILRVALARDPFGGFRWRSVVAIAPLILFAIWTLVSSSWSHSPGRAVLEFDRVVLYLLVLVLFASLRRRRDRMTALACGFALGSIVLGVAGLATRTLPAVFPITPEIANERLAYPVTYWNALGILAALGILVCLGLSASERLPRVVRALAAGAVPLLAATLLLTFSRGALAAGVVGLLVLCATCRTRALLFTLVATAPASALAIGAAYSATALATANPTGPDAVSQGRHVAIVALVTAIAALLVRVLLARWDRPSGRAPIVSARIRTALAVAGLTAVTAGALTAAVVFDLPHEVSRQYQRFLSEPTQAGPLVRQRLLNPSNDHRLPQWRVALDVWHAHTLRGSGAGTFQNEWNRHRKEASDVVNTHSLYLEVLSDLGVVGLVLLVISLVALVTGLASRIEGRNRAIPASLLAAAVAWLLHAGVDWDWQMPVLTWWLFAAGGLALGQAGGRSGTRITPARLGRLLAMLGIALLTLLPAQVALSQLNLDREVAAFKKGDCNASVRYGLNSIADIGARAEPYELIGYCDLRSGRPALAIALIQNAINRDPQDWEYHYDMAIARALDGLDPRSAARAALALNPLEPLTSSLARALRSSRPDVWRRHAARAKLLVP